jgi:hypothetical protein
MNIFATSPDPEESACALDDLRVAKMMMETAQLMSTAVRTIAIRDPQVYKSAYFNHPCSIWARTNKENFAWLRAHGRALVKEYKRRGGTKYHIAIQVIRRCSLYTPLFPSGKLQPNVNCTPHKDIKDVHEAYRITMIEKWKNDRVRTINWERPHPRWTACTPPSWLDTSVSA